MSCIFSRSLQIPLIGLLILLLTYNSDYLTNWSSRNDANWILESQGILTQFEEQLIAETSSAHPAVSGDLIFRTGEIYEPGHNNTGIDIEKVCPRNGTDLKLLIIVATALNHFKARQSIRYTWAHKGNAQISTLFIMGRSTSKYINMEVAGENTIYGDLIRGHFIDTYNNLTLKTISALQWVHENCAQVEYVLKADDDVFINVPLLLRFLDKHENPRGAIFGRVAANWKPTRNPKSKYCVSEAQFNESVYPQFTIGRAYVMSSNIIYDLYNRSLEENYLKLEDVYITGIIANQLDIPRENMPLFFNRKRHKLQGFKVRDVICLHKISAFENYLLWDIFNNTLS